METKKVNKTRDSIIEFMRERTTSPLGNILEYVSNKTGASDLYTEMVVDFLCQTGDLFYHKIEKMTVVVYTKEVRD